MAGNASGSGAGNRVIGIDSLAGSGDISGALGLKISALFSKYAGDDPNYSLKLAVCGACVLEVVKIESMYLAKFPSDGESALYWPNATLGDIVLAHCKCDKYQ